jgi:hypothetical protein
MGHYRCYCSCLNYSQTDRILGASARATIRNVPALLVVCSVVIGREHRSACLRRSWYQYWTEEASQIHRPTEY